MSQGNVEFVKGLFAVGPGNGQGGIARSVAGAHRPNL
jgi:hypothetical protein